MAYNKDIPYNDLPDLPLTCAVFFNQQMIF